MTCPAGDRLTLNSGKSHRSKDRIFEPYARSNDRKAKWRKIRMGPSPRVTQPQSPTVPSGQGVGVVPNCPLELMTITAQKPVLPTLKTTPLPGVDTKISPSATSSFEFGAAVPIPTLTADPPFDPGTAPSTRLSLVLTKARYPIAVAL